MQGGIKHVGPKAKKRRRQDILRILRCIGTPLDHLNENWESYVFCNLNKTTQVHEGSYSFLHSNSISRRCSARAFWGVGMMGRSIYFFFHLSRRYHELFFPYNFKDGTAEV